MPKITNFTPAVCKEIAARVAKALNDLGNELGVEIKPHGGSYTSGSYTMKLEFAILNENGVASTRSAEDFKMSAFLFGLKSDDLGRAFRSGGRLFLISGLRPRATRRPVVASCTESGKEFCFSAEDVKRALSFNDNPERTHAARER
jgi:hypothetical protein